MLMSKVRNIRLIIVDNSCLLQHYFKMEHNQNTVAAIDH